MSNNLGCVEHKIPLEEDGSCLECKRKMAALENTERALKQIERLPVSQQQHVLECGMRMRELACFYGPLFRHALVLTSCEIASGALIMPLEGECDRAQELMLPGGQRKDQIRNLVLPPGVKRH